MKTIIQTLIFLTLCININAQWSLKDYMKKNNGLPFNCNDGIDTLNFDFKTINHDVIITYIPYGENYEIRRGFYSETRFDIPDTICLGCCSDKLIRFVDEYVEYKYYVEYGTGYKQISAVRIIKMEPFIEDYRKRLGIKDEY